MFAYYYYYCVCMCVLYIPISNNTGGGGETWRKLREVKKKSKYRQTDRQIERKHEKMKKRICALLMCLCFFLCSTLNIKLISNAEHDEFKSENQLPLTYLQTINEIIDNIHGLGAFIYRQKKEKIKFNILEYYLFLPKLECTF